MVKFYKFVLRRNYDELTGGRTDGQPESSIAPLALQTNKGDDNRISRSPVSLHSTFSVDSTGWGKFYPRGENRHPGTKFQDLCCLIGV